MGPNICLFIYLFLVHSIKIETIFLCAYIIYGLFTPYAGAAEGFQCI